MPDGNQGRTDHDLLVTLDERTLHIAGEVNRIHTEISEHYVTRDEFFPVRVIAYGIVGTVCLGVMAAIIALVIQSE